MTEQTLKDARATHFLVALLRSQVQGWFARENVLCQLGHEKSGEDRLPHLSAMIDDLSAWHREIIPGFDPLMGDDGSRRDHPRLDEAGDLLDAVFEELIGMGASLNTLFAVESPLAERRDDAAYLLGCVAWCVYAMDNSIQSDLDFAGRFEDTELLSVREPQVDDSRKDVATVNSIFHYLKNGQSPEPELFQLIESMARPLPDGEIQQYAIAVGRYLTHLDRSPWPDQDRDL